MSRIYSFISIILCSLSLCFLTGSAFAQKNSIKGRIVDTSENKKLEYAIVALISLKDSALYRSVRTDVEGKFEVAKIDTGRYMLMVSYPKMADYLQSVDITATTSLDLKTIPMISKAELLAEVIVRAGVPVRMKGDTLEYTADSFSVKQGANVEEMLKRLPGIRVEKDGKIFAQGEEVKKVLVDGDEFFSDDPAMAAKYLQADAVDKVQVFDKKSEQAEFTGIDDGKRTKTINLKLKKNRKNGSFGKLSAGGDAKDYYHHEAMGALFSGAKKISVFGLSSKTGRQDLDYNEMSKYVNQDYEMIDDGTGTVFYRSDHDYEGDSYYGSGLPSIQSGGAHYSDKWNYDRQKLFTNYRIKQVNAAGWNSSSSITTLPDGTGFSSSSSSTDQTYSFQHKAAGNLTLKLDSFATMKISLNGAMGNNSGGNSRISESSNEKGVLVNNSAHISHHTGENRRFGSNISYRRSFRKEGRTLSIGFQQDYGRHLNNSYDSTDNNYFDPASGMYKSSDSLNQLQQTENHSESYAVRAEYTDKISSKWALSTEYGWKTAAAGNLFNTLNNVNGKFEQRIDTLSNDYDFTVRTHITGATISYRTKPMSITFGSQLYFTGLDQANNDAHEEKKRNFVNFAPKMNFNYRIGQTANFSVRYSGSTFQPAVEQLQPLRRSSNRLYVQVGNPDLKPGFRHNGGVNYSKYNWAKGKYMYAGLSVDYTDNSIGTSTFTDAQNRTTSQFINIDGIVSYSAYVNMGWEHKKWHLRPNMYTHINRYGNYTIQNGRKLKNETVSANTSFNLNHEWKNKMYTSYGINLHYGLGWSDIKGYQTQHNFAHTHTFSSTVHLPLKFEVSSNCAFNFQPKNSSFNTNLNTIQWNAWFQRKFLKNDQGVVRLSVNDILNNNTGYGRSLDGNTISEWNRLVIKRYWLLTLTWNFTKSIK